MEDKEENTKEDIQNLVIMLLHIMQYCLLKSDVVLIERHSTVPKIVVPKVVVILRQTNYYYYCLFSLNCKHSQDFVHP